MIKRKEKHAIRITVGCMEGWKAHGRQCIYERGLRTLKSCGAEREDEAAAKRKLFATCHKRLHSSLLRWFPLVSSVSVYESLH